MINKTLHDSQLQLPSLRLEQFGPAQLPTPDILSLVMGTQHSPEISNDLLNETGGIYKLAAYSTAELAKLAPGMTPERATKLLAAVELAKRLMDPPTDEPRIIRAPADAWGILHYLSGLEQEELHVISVTTKNRVIKDSCVYRGSIHTTVVRIADILRVPIRLASPAIIVAHNHPSGDPSPSPQDVELTRTLNEACKLVDIDLLDHVVIGTYPQFVSLKERGLGFG